MAFDIEMIKTVYSQKIPPAIDVKKSYTTDKFRINTSTRQIQPIE